MFREALFWSSLVLCVVSECTQQDDDCLATAHDAAASWVQMKTTKVETAKLMAAAKYRNSDGYFYTKRAGDAFGSNSIAWTVPQDFSNPSWKWDNEMDEQVRHSALIDDKLNIYVAGTYRLRKFSPDGKLLWLFNQDEKGNTSPTMGKGVIYFRVGQGEGHSRVYALSMDTGDVLFNSTVPGFDYGPDSQSLLLSGGRLFVPALARAIEGGCDSLIAMNASTGDQLWSYTTDRIMWNFSPTTPDDGKTITFSSTCGKFHKIDAETGAELIKTGEDSNAGTRITCGTGGGSVGPNGLFFAAHGSPKDGAVSPMGGFFQQEGPSFITAFNISTGEQAWQFPVDPGYQSNQYPAVGYLYEGGPLAVVAAVGENTGMPSPMVGEDLKHYLSDAEYRESLHVPHWKNAVIALDAATGRRIWRWDEADWDHFAAAGDEEGLIRRVAMGSPEGSMCLPDLQGIPIINTKDGTVIASSSHAGNMTLIRDANKNGIIEDGETTAFKTGIAFLNGPSAAPDMLVVSPCWGPMYVFRS